MFFLFSHGVSKTNQFTAFLSTLSTTTFDKRTTVLGRWIYSISTSVIYIYTYVNTYLKSSSLLWDQLLGLKLSSTPTNSPYHQHILISPHCQVCSWVTSPVLDHKSLASIPHLAISRSAGPFILHPRDTRLLFIFLFIFIIFYISFILFHRSRKSFAYQPSAHSFFSSPFPSCFFIPSHRKSKQDGYRGKDLSKNASIKDIEKWNKFKLVLVAYSRRRWELM